MLESHYVTRGKAMGANGSVIATVIVLARDPRAATSLKFMGISAFRTVMVEFRRVPPLVKVVKWLVGFGMACSIVFACIGQPTLYTNARKKTKPFNRKLHLESVNPWETVRRAE